MAHCSRRKHDRDVEKNPLLDKHHHSEKNQRRRQNDLYGLMAGGDNHRHEFRYVEDNITVIIFDVVIGLIQSRMTSASLL